MSKFESFRRGEGEVPAKQQAWLIYGAGMENVGQEGKPVEIPVPKCGPDQLLARIDAAGICFSDIKIIRQGGSHPRLFGRDLQAEPMIAGHEVSCTIVRVGEELAGQYNVGDRFVVQADIYFQGKNLAFGYMLPGAFEQYVVFGDEVLRGDDGCYLIPVQPETGYAEAALSEPWACVVCAYRTDFRRTLAEGGTAWIIAGEGAEGYTLGGLTEGPGPKKMVLTGAPADLSAEVTAAAETWGAEVVCTGSLAETTVEAAQAAHAPEGFEDLILLGTVSPELIEQASAAVGRHGVMALLGPAPSRPVEIDLGRIHYDYIRYYGSAGKDVSVAYAETRHPNYEPGGKAWIAGGGGPMGQMHVQIAAQAAQGPALIVISDLDDERLELLRTRLEHVAGERGREMVLLNPQALGQEAFEARLRELAPNGFDDLHMLVPVPPMIAGMVPWMGEQGVLDIFAGIPRGSVAATDLGPIITRGIRFQGTSGSAIEDLVQALHMTETGEIDANAAVAAIGGLEAVHDGLQAVIDMLVPGKIVIYPQIQDLPLTPLRDLEDTLPEVAALLGPGGVWTRAAEKALMEKLL